MAPARAVRPLPALFGEEIASVMPSRFFSGIKAAAFFCLLAFSAAAASKVLSIHDAMERMTVLHNRMEENLLNAGAAAAWEADGGALDLLYADLAESYGPFYGGSEDHWRSYCTRSREALANSRAARAGGDEKTARVEFFLLANIREEAHAEFRPGLWKRLFKRKPKETKQ
jgi:hypothetical protein